MKRNVCVVAVLVSLLMVFFFCEEGKNKNHLKIQLDSLLSAPIFMPFNGVVLITQNGEVIYHKVTGYADLEKQIPLSEKQPFMIGSISKQFTAAIVLQEYDKGSLDLFIPIRNYLPTLTESWADTVTVHHLLTHTHGITELDKPTLSNVGTSYNYSQIGYDLLAQITEITSGKSFMDLSQELFVALGMKNTFHPAQKGYQVAKGYIENENELVYTEEGFKIYPAAGGFISNAEDLVIWNSIFMEGKLFQPETFRAMVTKQPNAVRNHPVFGLTTYGYGITIDDDNSIIQWGQTGLVDGYPCMNFYFPDSGISVIVLTNIQYDSNLKGIFSYHTQILNMIRENFYLVQ